MNDLEDTEIDQTEPIMVKEGISNEQSSMLKTL